MTDETYIEDSKQDLERSRRYSLSKLKSKFDNIINKYNKPFPNEEETALSLDEIDSFNDSNDLERRLSLNLPINDNINPITINRLSIGESYINKTSDLNDNYRLNNNNNIDYNSNSMIKRIIGLLNHRRTRGMREYKRDDTRDAKSTSGVNGMTIGTCVDSKDMDRRSTHITDSLPINRDYSGSPASSLPIENSPVSTNTINSPTKTPGKTNSTKKTTRLQPNSIINSLFDTITKTRDITHSSKSYNNSIGINTLSSKPCIPSDIYDITYDLNDSDSESFNNITIPNNNIYVDFDSYNNEEFDLYEDKNNIYEEFDDEHTNRTASIDSINPLGTDRISPLGIDSTNPIDPPYNNPHTKTNTSQKIIPPSHTFASKLLSMKTDALSDSSDSSDTPYITDSSFDKDPFLSVSYYTSTRLNRVNLSNREDCLSNREDFLSNRVNLYNREDLSSREYFLSKNTINPSNIDTNINIIEYNHVNSFNMIALFCNSKRRYDFHEIHTEILNKRIKNLKENNLKKLLELL
eukprot:GHVP01053620.1.p1 GENE.GHVP01053620.1~~GHVP01053620.1.p1  ORF type:complete len:522 (+),score=52.60 GHVP01053620.1:322-1887(+)